jgi:hypothetical protein
MGLRPNLFMPCADLFSKIEPLRTPNPPGNCWTSRQNPPLTTRMALQLSLIRGFYREVRQSLGALEAPEAQKLLTGDAEFGYEEGTFMGDDVVGHNT